MNRKVKIIIVLIVGLFVSYRLIRQVDHEIIFDDEINAVLVVIAIGVFVFTIFNNAKEYTGSKKLLAFLPAAVAVCIGLGLLTTLHLMKLRDASPTKFSCVSKMNDFNGVSIDFRQDGTYKLTSWSLGADYYHGSYTIADSIITLDKLVIQNVIQSNRLLIRQDGDTDSLGIPYKSVYQIDKHGRALSQAVDFRLEE